MNKAMPIGISDFKEVKEQYYFVDKSYFIRDLIHSHKKVTLFTRPRRFGKTLTLSMLEYFFSIDKRNESAHLFTDLSIGKSPSILSHQGTYPVIFMTFKNFHNPSWDSMYRSFQLLIQDIYLQFSYLLDSPSLIHYEKDYINRLLSLQAEPEEYQISLQRLITFLYKHHHQKVILLLDEYDAPLQNAYNQHFYDKAILFWKGLFNAALKDNPRLHFAILTGVLRVAKESIFSGLNNLDVFSVLEEKFGNVFGFTPDEVKIMLHGLGYEQKFSELKAWYDGYSFGSTDIFNPWSVIKYINESCVPKPYWVNTADNSILHEILQQANPDRIQSLQQLVSGKSIMATLQEGLIYNEILRNDAALYTLLLNTGYLKALSAERLNNGISTYELAIPNKEITQVYTQEILGNLAQGIQLSDFLAFQTALLEGNSEVLTQKLQTILVELVSCYDVKSPESFYHGLLLGLTCLLQHNGYTIESNRESGYGRFDLAVMPLPGTQRHGVMMEFKIAPDINSLERKATEALQQIKTKQYTTEFKKRHISSAYTYGIAFYGKHVTIKHTTWTR